MSKYYYADIGGDSRPLAFRRGNSLYYTHPDHLNSTALITSDAGQEVGRITYYPYGLTRSTSGTLPTDKRFTGQRLDEGTGLLSPCCLLPPQKKGETIDGFVREKVRLGKESRGA